MSFFNEQESSPDVLVIWVMESDILVYDSEISFEPDTEKKQIHFKRVSSSRLNRFLLLTIISLGSFAGMGKRIIRTLLYIFAFLKHGALALYREIKYKSGNKNTSVKTDAYIIIRFGCFSFFIH